MINGTNSSNSTGNTNLICVSSFLKSFESPLKKCPLEKSKIKKLKIKIIIRVIDYLFIMFEHVLIDFRVFHDY